MRVKTETLLLLVVLAASLVIRLVPIAADLPSVSSLDELSYIEAALRFGTGSLDLHSFFHGGLYQLILFLEYAAYFALGWLLGWFRSSTDFLTDYLRDPSRLILIARVTAALCGVGIVALSYLIASKMYRPTVGLLAALFTASSLLMFQMSFLALADLPAVFLLMLAIYLAARSVEQPDDVKLYAAAAALVGLAAAAKYHAAFGVVPLAVAALIKCRHQKSMIGALVRLGAIGALSAAAGFCLGIPQIVFDWRTFYEDVFHRLGGQYAGYDPGRVAWRFVFTHHLRNGLGIPLELASLGGLVFALYNRSKWDIMLVSLPISLYLLLMNSIGFAYHWLPAIPIMLILAARFLDALVEKALGRDAPGVSLLIAALVAAPTFLDSLRLVQVMRSPSTKTAAKSWIEEHIPEGSVVMAEGYVLTVPTFGPPLVENRSTLERDVALVRESKGSGRAAALRLANHDRFQQHARTYEIVKVPFFLERLPPDSPRYVITSSARDSLAGKELESMFMSDDYRARRAAFRENIGRDYIAVANFAPAGAFTNFFPHVMDEDYRLIREWPLRSSGRLRGPTITIWERRTGT